MVLTTTDLKNVERSEHVLECFAEVSTSMVVKSKVGVTVSSAWVVIS